MEMASGGARGVDRIGERESARTDAPNDHDRVKSRRLLRTPDIVVDTSHRMNGPKRRALVKLDHVSVARFLRPPTSRTEVPDGCEAVVAPDSARVPHHDVYDHYVDGDDIHHVDAGWVARPGRERRSRPVHPDTHHAHLQRLGLLRPGRYDHLVCVAVR